MAAQMTMEGVELLACPLCGNEEITLAPYRDGPSWQVECESVDADGCGLVIIRLSKVAVINAWNRRARPIAPADAGFFKALDDIASTLRFEGHPISAATIDEAAHRIRNATPAPAVGENSLRIVIWNELRRQGIAQNACYPIINGLMAALAHSPSPVRLETDPQEVSDAVDRVKADDEGIRKYVEERQDSIAKGARRTKRRFRRSGW